ncbi:hypothetical protein I4U23_024180 [Adineta vaga]|nr:hypothetical protein I4U23_024180 [Adineta vaga]
MGSEEDALISSILNSKTIISKCIICELPTSHSYFRVTVCSTCRLNKCFASGIEIEQSRCSMPTKKMLKTQHKTTSQSMILTVNILSDRLNLSIDQSNHISNLIHCFDRYGPFSVVQQFVLEQNSLPVKLRYKPTALNEFFTSIYLKTEQVLEQNVDYRTLCSHDRSILSHRTIRYVAGFTAIVVLYKTKLLDDTLFYKTSEHLFETDIRTALKCITNYFDDDITFLKLIITVSFFSIDNYTVFTNNDIPKILIDPKSILRIQDTYIELAWKYMMQKHSFEYTVLCFDELVRSLLHYYRIIRKVEVIQAYTDTIHFLISRTKQIVINSDN